MGWVPSDPPSYKAEDTGKRHEEVARLPLFPTAIPMLSVSPSTHAPTASRGVPYGLLTGEEKTRPLLTGVCSACCAGTTQKWTAAAFQSVWD